MVRREDVPPFIVEPVFVRGADGKIAPHRMIWPAFWGRMKGEAVSPVALDDAAQEALGTKGLKSEDWKPLTEEQIAKGLKALSAKKDGEAVYVCGGKLHRLGADCKAAASDHPAAAPYSWPVGHDVRPAAQSLGSGGCTDCHAPKAGFFYASVAPPSPARVGAPARRMYEYQGQNPDDLKAWNATARYRRVWIWINLAAAGVLACVFINFSVMGLGAIFRAIFMKKPHRVEQ